MKISYDGSYPNKCSGTFTIARDSGQIIHLTYVLSCPGYVGFGKDYSDEIVEDTGTWEYDEEVLEKALTIDEIEEFKRWVMDNIPTGHCGGCL